MRLLLVLLAAIVVSSSSFDSPARAQGSNTAVELKLLSIAGWLGNLEPVTTSAGPSGGAALLAAHWRAERTPATLALGTGNSFGSTPPLSNLFADQPTIAAMNLIGFDVDTLGNDNFDHGIGFLQRAIDASMFDYVAANLERVEENLRGVERYRIYELQGVKVAVIGVTDPASPTIVFPGHFGTIEVTNPAAAARAARQESARAGAEVFVLITEMGADDARSGPLIDLARGIQGFDAILGRAFAGDFSATVNGALVVANQARGVTYARTSLSFEPGAGVVGKSASFVRPTADRMTPAADLEALVQRYHEQLVGRLARVIAVATTPLPESDICGNPRGRLCESLLANLITDAVRAEHGADFALMNAGAIQGPLTCEAAGGPGFCPESPNLVITEGMLQSMHSFGNLIVRVTVTGPELRAMLEHGVGLLPETHGRFPQVSGLCYSYDISRPAGSRLINVTRHDSGGCGQEVDLGAGTSYSLATSDFIVAGGDGYAVPVARPVVGRTLLDIVRGYLRENQPVTPGPVGRIFCTTSGAVPCPQPAAPAAVAIGRAPITPPATGSAGLR